MDIVYIPVAEITEDAENAKIHPSQQINEIKRSIVRFGNNDPIAVWGPKNVVVEGNGRLRALKELGYAEAACIRLDELTDDERRAYGLVHNKLTLDTGFDEATLSDILGELKTIDLSEFGLQAQGGEGYRLETIKMPEPDFQFILLCVPFKDVPEVQSAIADIANEYPAVNVTEYIRP